MSKFKSIITNYPEYCLICGKPAEAHHIFKGNKQRKLSDEDLIIMPLCPDHHRGNLSAHQTKELNVLCEIIGQLAYEKKKCAEGYGEAAARESFRLRYGRSYI